MTDTLDRWLHRRIWLRRALLLCTLAAVAYLDANTGFELSLLVLYLVPVGLAAWYEPRPLVALVAVSAGAAWFWADYASGHAYSEAAVRYWNAFIRFATFAIIAILVLRVREAMAELLKMAMKDPLTGLDNARALEFKYATLRDVCMRKHVPLSFCLIDLDGFKAVNDRFGHERGDAVLREFADVLRQVTRGADLVARTGGDEFAVVLHDTDADEARQYNQRLRHAFQDSPLPATAVDFSMGVAVFVTPPEDIEVATREADALMYTAKRDGKRSTLVAMPASMGSIATAAA